MARTYYLQTLGCKLNQDDSASLARALAARGMHPAARPEDADLLVVNTCTVTGRADADGRSALRRLARINPGARLVAMGCYARRDPAALAALPGVHQVSGGADPEPVVAAAAAVFPGQLTAAVAPYHAGPPAGGRTRSTLKIQDGCDLACSYCIIPTVRGRSRSIPAAQVEESLRRLVDAGYLEIVLTGVNSGDYGRDLPGETDLLGLLRRLTRVPGLGRLRLNSLEPRTVSPALIDFMGDAARLAPHLQIPLQSGSDAVLARMRRNYRRADYVKLLERLAARVPDIGLGADIIVGFPGETDDDFAASAALVRDSPLSYLHVFSYSSRPGTDAAALPGAVPAATIKARAIHLRTLAVSKGAAFRRRFVGRTLEALTLAGAPGDESIRALTGNFFEVALPAGSALPNRLLPVEVTASNARGARGNPAAAGPAAARSLRT